ncbi:hypothetical protein BDN71DRAFT_1512079 [Pleurotus eryngii]|uniref:Uncharacterized protein n=1 Tax=Pleurotus eryngii TaxID=5323 RepID=A0A9P6DBF9_PLEER|nr:hypothetical protein BDN71DRAFT_1512079 [Pleurotus eryngii]
MDVAIQEEKEKSGGNESVGVEKKSVRFADNDDEVFIIEPRAERHGETVATEVLTQRQSYSNSNSQFTPHLEPSRAMKRFQTVEKLLEMLDEQMKAFLRARNMWVEWRVWMKEGKWASPDADSDITMEEQRKSPTSKEESGFRTQEINGVARLIMDANEVEKPDPDNSGKQANNDWDTSRCYASIRAMGVQSPTTPAFTTTAVNPLPNDPPLLNDSDGPSDDILPSMLKPLSPSPSPLLVPTGPPLPTVLTDTPSPTVHCPNPNPPHTYTLASAFNFDGAFSVIVPFCDANIKHGLKTAGVCARIWGVKEMVENVVGIKFKDGTIAAKGRNGEENRDQGSSLMSTNDSSMNATSIPPIGPTYALTDTSRPRILPHSTADSSRKNSTKPSMHITPPSNLNPRPLCINATQPDTPPELKPNQHSFAHCPPERTLNINTHVLRVILTVTILDDPSHPRPEFAPVNSYPSPSSDPAHPFVCIAIQSPSEIPCVQKSPVPRIAVEDSLPTYLNEFQSLEWMWMWSSLFKQSRQHVCSYVIGCMHISDCSPQYLHHNSYHLFPAGIQIHAKSASSEQSAHPHRVAVCLKVGGVTRGQNEAWTSGTLDWKSRPPVALYANDDALVVASPGCCDIAQTPAGEILASATGSTSWACSASTSQAMRSVMSSSPASLVALTLNHTNEELPVLHRRTAPMWPNAKVRVQHDPHDAYDLITLFVLDDEFPWTAEESSIRW